MAHPVLIIGKLYFFDSAKVSYGELVLIDDNGNPFFKPFKNTVYDEENGLVEFATHRGFYPYEESKFNQEYEDNQREADEIVNFTDNL